MLIHTVVLTFFILFLYLSSTKIKNEKWIYAFSFLLFLFFVGFRSLTTGNDTMTYVGVFKSNPPLPSITEYFDSRFELGFLTLNHIIYNYISTNYSVFLFTYAFLTLSILFYVVRKESVNPYLSIFIYYAIFLKNVSSNIRATLAMSLVLLAYHFLVNKKTLRAVLAVLLASSFHISSLVFFLAFFLRKVRIGTKGLFAIALGTVAFSPILRPLMLRVLSQSKYESYTTSNWFNSSAKLGVLNMLGINAMTFALNEYSSKNKKLSEKENFLRNIIIVGLVFAFMCIQTALLMRFATYFIVFTILYIPIGLSNFKSRDYRNIGQFLTFVTVLLCVLYFYFITIFKPDWYEVYGYQNVLLEWLFNLKLF